MSTVPGQRATSSALGRYSDLGLALLAVSVLVLMVLPLPPWMLDALLALNIASGIVLLLFALYVPSPLAFSTFPSVLLFTTLFRIALNVATTRQILLHAHAGEIIDAFGRLVVGGSVIVGLVVFLIITIIQFIVIAKGAERVAEVGARFTLDAMPGKQMSIDSDLRAGLISQADAFSRRRELVQESQFFGAMDGAMKFVKGDAIAGMIIVVVNLLGGMAIGAFVLGMPLAQAVQKYSVLSIGDGLVSQIPALFIAMAAGVVVTRTAPDEANANLGGQIGRQLATQPRALLLSGVVMGLFALVPGFPVWVFLMLGAVAMLSGVMLSRRDKAQGERERDLLFSAAARDGDSYPVYFGDAQSMSRSRSAFRLELGSSLPTRIGVPALNLSFLRGRLDMRRQSGLPFPGVCVESNPSLADDHFRVLVQGLPAPSFAIPLGAQLALASRSAVAEAGLTVGDEAVPEVLQPAIWVKGSSPLDLAKKSIRSLDAAGVVAETVLRTIQAHATEAVGVQEVRQLLRELEPTHGDLVRETLSVIPLARFADMCSALARDRVPLADLPVLLQSIVAAAASAKDSDGLFLSVRLAMARGIVARHVGHDGRLCALAFDRAGEAALASAVEVRPDGPWLALPASTSDALMSTISAAAASAAGARATILLLPGNVRRAVGRLARSRVPHLGFVSYEEVAAAGMSAEVVVTIPKPPELAAAV